MQPLEIAVREILKNTLKKNIINIKKFIYFTFYTFVGGTGRVLQWRNEACTSSSIGGACLFPAGRQFRNELTFIPSGNTESLGVRTITSTSEGDKAAWQNPYSSKDESVEAGREYTFKTAGGVGPEFRGKMITSQLQIYRESDNIVEACVAADFSIV